MKILYLIYPFFILLIASGFNIQPMDQTPETSQHNIKKDSVLRHVALFKYKENTSRVQIAAVEKAFEALQNKIPEILSFEWGTNNSPEGLDKGYTHCFFLTFASEADRDLYLPHPAHKAFGSLLSPLIEDVLVIDYWTH